MEHRRLARCFLATALLAVAGYAGAASCVLDVPAAGVEFGNYDPDALLPRDESMVITVRCTGFLLETVNYEVQIDAGTGSIGAGDPFNPRQMVHASAGGVKLNYNLYTDPARTLIWKDSDPGLLGHTAVGSFFFLVGGTQEQFRIAYGRIFAQQVAPPGDYNDSVIVTVEYN